jgi:hypothetical protein
MFSAQRLSVVSLAAFLFATVQATYLVPISDESVVEVSSLSLESRAPPGID